MMPSSKAVSSPGTPGVQDIAVVGKTPEGHSLEAGGRAVGRDRGQVGRKVRGGLTACDVEPDREPGLQFERRGGHHGTGVSRVLVSPGVEEAAGPAAAVVGTRSVEDQV